MLVELYRKYVSQNFRDKLRCKTFLGSILLFPEIVPKKLRYKILFRKFFFNEEKCKLYDFRIQYGLTPYPYSFMLEYKKFVPILFFDECYKMYYVIHNGKKLYFPKSYKKERIIITYRNVIIEQDFRSPHQYVKNINRLKGKILLDIGAAEAIFSLETIELVNHVYIFECDDNWIEALITTFEPWKDKVTIIRKYVSDVNNENNITIDRFLEGKEKTNLFLKMDIEGYEQAALRGASNTLKEAKDIDFSICTYHRENDAVEIAEILRFYNFDYEQTNGYLYIQGSLRKAIIRKI